MRAVRRAAFFVGVALALCATRAGADSVFLRNGTRLAGEVDTAHGEVTVKTEDGVLTLPAWRVARVERADAPAVPSPQCAGGQRRGASRQRAFGTGCCSGRCTAAREGRPGDQDER